MPKRSELPASKRVEVALALLRKEEPAAQIACWHGISEQTSYRWKDELVAGGNARMACVLR